MLWALIPHYLSITNQANVVVLKDGWYFEMNDLIQNEFILFAENYSELENIIKNKKSRKVNIDEI